MTMWRPALSLMVEASSWEHKGDNSEKAVLEFIYSNFLDKLLKLHFQEAPSYKNKI